MYHVRMVRSQSVDLLFISWLFKQKLTLPLYGQYPNPFLIKKNKRRKKRQFHSKIVILDVETTFHIHFLSSELQCLPRGDPENLCENTKIQLLITHLFPQNFKNQVVRIKIVLRIYFYAPI